MSTDRDRRLRAVDDEERERSRTHHEDEERQTWERSGPLQRLLGVAGACGALVAFGFGLETIGLGREFATVATVTVLVALSYYAEVRPERVRSLAGSYWHVVDAFLRSWEDARRNAHRRPVRVGLARGFVHGLIIVAIQSALFFVISNVYTWHMAVAFGAAVGALVVAPQFFKDLSKGVRRGPADHTDYHHEAEDEDQGEDDEEWEEDDDEARG